MKERRSSTPSIIIKTRLKRIKKQDTQNESENQKTIFSNNYYAHNFLNDVKTLEKVKGS